MPRKPEDYSGLAPWAVVALGFDRMCQCGHENGLHDTPGPCAVLGCECRFFSPENTESRRAAVKRHIERILNLTNKPTEK